MNRGLVYALAALAVGLIAASQAFFIVDQREQAIVLQFGQPVGTPGDDASTIKGPGLHMKIPLIQEIRRFDRRLLSIDPEPEQVVIASTQAAATETAPSPEGASMASEAVIKDVSGEPIILDAFARYRIVDPLQFLKTLRTVENADLRLKTILNNTTRDVLGQTTLRELLSKDRTAVMASIQKRVNAMTTTDRLGIEIVDVRIVRADLTAELHTSTVRRMISELKERATETRAMGEERALEIRSTADKERTVLLAEAQRDSQIIRGKGDEEAIKIYSAAFNKDKDFYAFIRSMEAYRNTMANPDTRLILSPDSKFFRYFGTTSSGKE
ncbi:MAG: protease modulator HflC [Alphaproteobacteria bacterium]|nr:protease modulator HflC [Alphaproteobacteria bacterium]